MFHLYVRSHIYIIPTHSIYRKSSTSKQCRAKAIRAVDLPNYIHMMPTRDDENTTMPTRDDENTTMPTRNDENTTMPTRDDENTTMPAREGAFVVQDLETNMGVMPVAQLRRTDILYMTMSVSSTDRE